VGKINFFDDLKRVVPDGEFQKRLGSEVKTLFRLAGQPSL